MPLAPLVAGVYIDTSIASMYARYRPESAGAVELGAATEMTEGSE